VNHAGSLSGVRKTRNGKGKLAEDRGGGRKRLKTNESEATEDNSGRKSRKEKGTKGGVE